MDDNREVIFCRICLRTDLTRKYILSEIAQRKFIERFFKENGYHKDLDEHSYACFECRALLHRSYIFIQKALRAQKALYELQEKQEPLTNSLLQSLDRAQYNIKSNLASYEPETYVFQTLEVIFDGKDNVSVKKEPSESQDDLNTIGPNVVQNSPNNYQIDSSFTREIDSKDKILINPLQSEFTVDSECIPNNTNNYIDVKTEPEVILEENEASVDEYDYLENFDPLNKLLVKDSNRNGSDSDVLIISSDDSYAVKKVKKRKQHRKKKNKKKITRKPVPKRKLTLNLLSDDEVKKKPRIKVEWPKMPILEERFRTRKRVKYSGLDDLPKEDEIKIIKKAPDDEDFVPAGEDSSDASADDSCDSYDDEGKVIKRKKDTREFPMECEQCESIITSRKEHQYHYLHMHRDAEYPYSNYIPVLCQVCGETVSKSRLKEHESRHAGLKFECDICHKEYSSKSVLANHKARVHQAGARSTCVCDYCQMEFFMKSELIRHIRTHTGEKPFKCHLCDYRVAHKGNLYVHVRTFHQHMRTSKKKPKKSEKDSQEHRSGKKKIAKGQKKSKKEKNLEENGSGKEDKSRKRKIRDSREKKKTRKKKVATDSDTE